MSLRFRLASTADLPTCAALLRRENCFLADDPFWDRLQDRWQALLDSPAAAFVVWEDLAAGPAERLQSFAISAIVSDAFVDEVRARGRAWASALVYERIGTHASPLLAEREIARANGGEGVNIFVLHNALRYRELSDPRLRAVIPVGMAAFYFCHSGYYARSVLWEIYGTEHARLIAEGGYRLLDNFGADPQASRLPDARRPFLMGMLRDEFDKGTFHPNVQWLFTRVRPHLQFTPAQRRLLRHALLGLSDQELAADLGISADSVLQAWRAILDRAFAALPGLFPADAGGVRPGVRGPSVRRRLLDYLRQNPCELRPWSAQP